jgi:hypothetical protein
VREANSQKPKSERQDANEKMHADFFVAALMPLGAHAGCDENFQNWSAKLYPGHAPRQASRGLQGVARERSLDDCGTALCAEG